MNPADLSGAVVVLEKQRRKLGLGVVLAKDGRILTAYSSLGDTKELEARWSDGKSARVRLVHSDLGWDLALLGPVAGAPRSEGLPASLQDPARANASLSAFEPSKHHVAPAAVSLKGHRTLVGAGDAVLRDALEFGAKLSPAQLGSPVVDEAGGVVAIVGRACLPAEEGKEGCTLVSFGVPVSAIRRFLRAAPPRTSPQPWLGVQAVADTMGPARGLRIQVVRPESPADVAGLKGGAREEADLLVAVDGVPVSSPEALSKAIAAHPVGDRVQVLVFGAGRFRVLTLTLTAAPESLASGSADPSTGASAEP